MYEKLKKILPRTLLKRNEDLLRKIIALFYIGNTHQCNVCDFKMRRFVVLKNKDRLCPKCGSLSRTRRLWSLLEPEVKGKKVLHFSPPKSLRAKLGNYKNIEYITSDYLGEFKAMKQLNIESIDEPDNTYDIVICYHVLEHIENDIKAMKELYRITKPGGKCFIQTPFKDGDIYENSAIKTEEDRLKHFGQEDHVRIYSANGLINRLESVGFKTTLKTYKEESNNRNGFNSNETVIIVEK